ncbi:MAG TPA: hypothetical protein VFA66_06970 [Gaiellaceae bacterium]|nr:hypothetical protein [Gaiellaceae bacterium]
MKILASTAVSAAAAVLFSAVAAAGNPLELPRLPSNDVDARPLQAGGTFQATAFPLALRITTPDGSWLGGQGKIATQKRGTFGWVEFLQRPAARPLGAISMIGSYDPTPSVAATVAQLRTGVGATFQATRPARLAGFSGSQFDGQVTGKHHVFVPFSPVTHAATFHPDAYRFDAGEVFRIVVLSVRGRTVVLLLENVALPADQFPAFLDSAGKLLGSLRFPA